MEGGGVSSKRGREAVHADSALLSMLFPQFGGIRIGGRSRWHRLKQRRAAAHVAGCAATMSAHLADHERMIS
jgi:hypothetical protein